MATLFRTPGLPVPVLIAGAACSVLPDLDVLTFRLGVPYGSVFGHRGITHSLAFALALGGVVASVIRARVPEVPARTLWLYLFAASASHGIFDALTNGGRGVAFFAPFSDRRYFLPFRPIEVSPLSLGGFLSGRGVSVLISEAKWVWLPSFGFALLVLTVHALVRGSRRNRDRS